MMYDAPKREGELSFDKTHARWVEISAHERVKKTAEEYKRDNARTGSSFFAPTFNFSTCKQNGGIMHTPCRHITHFWVSISNCIREFMSDKEWQQRMSTIADEVALKSKEIVKQSREAHSITEIKSIKRQLLDIRRKVKEPMTQEVVPQELFIWEQNMRAK